MSSGSTNRFLIVGESGSGKSTLAAEMVAEYMQAGERDYLVVLTMDSPDQSAFLPHVTVTIEVHDEEVKLADAGRLEALIRAENTVLFEITALEAAPFLEALGHALMRLGNTLLVVDEAPQIVTNKAPSGILQIWTRGRKRAIDVIAIGQSLKQRAQLGINPIVINRSTAVIAFQFSDTNELEDLRKRFPHSGSLIQQLQSPRDGKPEYVQRDNLTGLEQAVTREGLRTF